MGRQNFVAIRKASALELEVFRLEDAYGPVGRTAFLSAPGVSENSARSRKPALFPVRGDRGRRKADSGRLAPMRPGIGVICIGILLYSLQDTFARATDRIEFALAPEGLQRCRMANASTTTRAKRFRALFSTMYSDTV